MFSQVSVILSTGVEYPWFPVPSGGSVCLVPGLFQGVPTLWLLTPSGAYHTYGRQAGSMHPTGML